MTIEKVRGTITALSFGGEGILRHEGFVFFIPYTTVGDQIVARVVEKKARFGRAVLEEIVEPAEERTLPRCPYFERCGGCQLQHLDAGRQMDYKTLWLLDSLKRIGKLPLELIPRQFAATQEEAWYYRRHIRLTLMPSQNGFTIGYQGAVLGSFVQVEQCALFLAQEDRLFIKLSDLLQGLKPPNNEPASLVLTKLSQDRFFCRYTFSKPLDAVSHAYLLRNWQCDLRIKGFSIETPDKRQVFGESRGYFSFGQLKIQFSPFAFVQAHPAQSGVLYTQIAQVIQRLRPKAFLDLYCGIGVTSLIAAGLGTRVLGIEGSPEAIECAKENALQNNIENVDFLCEDVAKSTFKALKGLSPELVLVNPPRTGIDPRTREMLLKNPPPAILYISCMPPTLARDVVFFVEAGFKPTELAVFDLFPQTTHMETLLLLEKC